MNEIGLNEPFGKIIRDVIRERGYKINLEIGSGDGTGSTQCFIDGMNGRECMLQCLEIDPARYEQLCANPKMHYWVSPYRMSSIPDSKLIPRSFDEIWDSPHNNHRFGRQEYSREVVKKWYDECLTLPKSDSEGFLTSSLCLKAYDAVLIDGNEFTGYSEFVLLKDKTKCFFLDDVFHAYKCAQIYNELIDDPKWELLHQDREVRNGFAVFARR